MDLSELIPGNEPNGNTDLNKQDILQLLNTGLKENQNFAKWFADTVLRDIQRKLKDIKIQSSPIQIDGKAISKDINDGIREGLEKDIDKTVDTIRKEITEKGKEITKSADKSPMSISSILGQTPGMSKFTQMKFQGLTRNILDKIEKGLPNKIDLGAKDGIKLGDIFSTSDKDKIPSIGVWMKWNKIQKDIIDKLAKGLPNKIELSKEGVRLNDIFITSNKDKIPSLDIWLRWNKLQKLILDKTSTAVRKGVELDGIKLGDIMGVTQSAGLFTYTRWINLQKLILDKTATAVRKGVALNDGISINDIMGVPPKLAGLFTGIKWINLQRTILNKAQKKAEKKDEDDDVKADNTKKPKTRAFKSLEEKEPTVKVGGFTATAIKDLSSLPGLGKMGKIDINQKKDKDGMIPGWVKAIGLGGLALIGGGIAAGIKGLFDDGPFKGLEKIIARGAIKLGSTITKFASSLLLNGIGKYAKVLGKQIASIAKMFGSGASKMAAPIVKLLKGGVGGKVAEIFGKLFTKAGLKKIPFGIGAVFGIGFGISRFIQGDIAGGLLEFASGIASIVPWAGTALSVAIDVLLAKRDMSGGGSKELAKKSPFNKKWRDVILPLIEKIPIVNALIKIPKAMGAFSTGDWKTGLKELAAIIPGLGTIYDMVSGAAKEASKPSVSGKPKSISKIMGDMFTGAIKTWWKGAPWWLKKIIKGSGLLDQMGIKLDESKDEMRSPVAVSAPALVKAVASPAQDERKQKRNEKANKAEYVNKKDTPKMTYAEKTKRAEAMVKSGEVKPVSESSRSYDAAVKRAMLQLSSKDSANDFIWRAGKPIQKFTPKDNIIATKDSGVFDKLLVALKEDKKQVPQNNQQLHQDINKLIQKMNNVMDIVAASSKGSKNEAPQKDGLAGIPEDAGTMRDPAYILRSRAWDRIRKGYVVI